MSAITVHESEYATIWYHPESKIVHHKFHKFIYGEEFRKVLESGLQLFQEKGAAKWLSDDRLNSAIPREDGEWGIVNWSPRVMAAGWKYWAIVMPDKNIGKKNMELFMKTYIEQGLTIETFEDADEALKWLESK